jgi:hypothetical protein
LEHQVRLFQVLVGGEQPQRQRLSLFRHPLGEVRPQRLLQGRVESAAGQAGGAGREVDGRQEQATRRPRLLKVHPHHAPDRLQLGHQVELHLHPRAPLALSQDDVAALDADDGGLLLLVHVDLEGHVHPPLLDRDVWTEEGVDRSYESRCLRPLSAGDLHAAVHDGRPQDPPAADGLVPVFRVRGEVRERAVRALDVRRTHPREHLGRSRSQREVRRHLVDRGGYAVRFRHFPQGGATPQQLRAGGGGPRVTGEGEAGPAGGVGCREP